MRAQLDHSCEQHPDPSDCPDALVGFGAGEYGIYVHDGGSSWVRIEFCPWCGADLSRVDERGQASSGRVAAGEDDGFPDDDNGHVLRKLAARGDDLSKAREIDFAHLMPSREAAEILVARLQSLGEVAQASQDEDDGTWTVICTREMVPTHGNVTAVESFLASLAGELGGHADGWGCFVVRE